ncbi:MAG: hypothetical protein NTZ92_05560 [Candidatus Omnitrophica bacterium]|nr:hypothetical protein [Candidatus Omnitrophota bacterium]
MNSKIVFIVVVLVLIAASIVYAVESVNVSGVNLALIEGAVHSGNTGIGNASVETFTISKPLAEVVAFYSVYFKNNGFLIIGGEDSSGFNASVKKDSSMFTVKIFVENGKTILQFVW